MEEHLYYFILCITLILFYCICASCSATYSADNVEFPLVFWKFCSCCDLRCYYKSESALALC